MSDLCLPTTPLSWKELLILRLICRLSGVPFGNIRTPARYVETLETLGFEEVTLTDITPFVFPGFLRFLHARDKALGPVLSRRWTGLYAASRNACEWWIAGKAGRLRFVLVGARKRDSFVH